MFVKQNFCTLVTKHRSKHSSAVLKRDGVFVDFKFDFLGLDNFYTTISLWGGEMGLIPLFGQMQLIVAWTKMLLARLPWADHRNIWKTKVNGLVWVNRIWLWVRDGELVSAGVGGLWVWCSEREGERESKAHPIATNDSDQPLGLQSAIIPNRCCASIISILHSCKVTICT